MTKTLFYSAFVIGLLVANFGLHAYLWRRLIRDTALRGRWRLAVGGLIVCFALLVPINFAVSRLFVRGSLFPLPQVIWTWLGVAFYLLTIFVASDVLRLARRYFGGRDKCTKESPQGDGGEDESTLDRRLFVSRAIASSAAVAATGITGYGVVSANGDFYVPEVPVKLPRLPRQLDGFRIVHVSDIHIGPVLDGRFIDHLVETANALKPDLVCITGDLVDGSVPAIGQDVGRLTKLKSKYGVAFSTGNHEYYAGVAPWLQFLSGLGFHVLGNQRISIWG